VNTPEKVAAQEPSLAQEWLHALRYWLGGRRGVLALATLAIATGAALNWSWLVATGVAPLLLAVLPCAVMCGLGLCLSRMTGNSCASGTAASKDTAPPQALPPAAVDRPRLDAGDRGLPARPAVAPVAAEDTARSQAPDEGEGVVQPQTSDEEKIDA
jgi:hypothetical protein